MKVFCVLYDGEGVGVASAWLSEEKANREAQEQQRRDDAAHDAKNHYVYSVQEVEVSDTEE